MEANQKRLVTYAVKQKYPKFNNKKRDNGWMDRWTDGYSAF